MMNQVTRINTLMRLGIVTTLSLVLMFVNLNETNAQAKTGDSKPAASGQATGKGKGKRSWTRKSNHYQTLTIAIPIDLMTSQGLSVDNLIVHKLYGEVNNITSDELPIGLMNTYSYTTKGKGKGKKVHSSRYNGDGSTPVRYADTTYKGGAPAFFIVKDGSPMVTTVGTGKGKRKVTHTVNYSKLDGFQYFTISLPANRTYLVNYVIKSGDRFTGVPGIVSQPFNWVMRDRAVYLDRDYVFYLSQTGLTTRDLSNIGSLARMGDDVAGRTGMDLNNPMERVTGIYQPLVVENTTLSTQPAVATNVQPTTTPVAPVVEKKPSKKAKRSKKGDASKTDAKTDKK